MDRDGWIKAYSWAIELPGSEGASLKLHVMYSFFKPLGPEKRGKATGVCWSVRSVSSERRVDLREEKKVGRSVGVRTVVVLRHSRDWRLGKEDRTLKRRVRSLVVCCCGRSMLGNWRRTDL